MEITKIKHTDSWGDFMEIRKSLDGTLLITCTDCDSDASVSVNVTVDDFMVIVGQVMELYGDVK